MILNQPQAEAVYSAMCALNNVSAGFLRTDFPHPTDKAAHIYFQTYPDGSVNVNVYHSTDRRREDYLNQAVFATAYGLN